MFLNMGGSEFIVIALVVLIAVGPEQLPGVLRKVGTFMSQARSMTAGFRQEFMSGLDEVKDVVDPKQWMGTGTDDDPIVPRGSAKSHKNGDSDGQDSGDSNGQAEAPPSSGQTNAPTADDAVSGDPAANDAGTNDVGTSGETTEDPAPSDEAEDVS